MTNVFIDTNILLNFFSYSTDHLNKLEELVSLIKAEKIRLFVPQQIVDEFNRNREVKLKVVLKNLNSFATDLQSPVVCHDFDEMKKIQKLLTELSNLRKSLIESVTVQIKARSLKADTFIDELFFISKPFAIGKAILSKAKMRFDLGNPPGKDGYGDAVNWETLLEIVPNSEDLIFIGRDKDYVSAIDPSDFSSFLKDEWKTKKKSQIFYYDLLSKFLKDKFVEAKITDEEIKEEKKVAEQLSSGSSNTSSVFGTYRFDPDFMARLNESRDKMMAITGSTEFQRSMEEYQKKLDNINRHSDIIEKMEKFQNNPEVMKRLEELGKKLKSGL